MGGIYGGHIMTPVRRSRLKKAEAHKAPVSLSPPTAPDRTRPVANTSVDIAIAEPRKKTPAGILSCLNPSSLIGILIMVYEIITT